MDNGYPLSGREERAIERSHAAQEFLRETKRAELLATPEGWLAALCEPTALDAPSVLACQRDESKVLVLVAEILYARKADKLADAVEALRDFLDPYIDVVAEREAGL